MSHQTQLRQEVAYYNCFTFFLEMIKPCVPSHVAYGHVHTGNLNEVKLMTGGNKLVCAKLPGEYSL